MRRKLYCCQKCDARLSKEECFEGYHTKLTLQTSISSMYSRHLDVPTDSTPSMSSKTGGNEKVCPQRLEAMKKSFTTLRVFSNYLKHLIMKPCESPCFHLSDFNGYSH
jgi:hypothetical protein